MIKRLPSPAFRPCAAGLRRHTPPVGLYLGRRRAGTLATLFSRTWSKPRTDGTAAGKLQPYNWWIGARRFARRDFVWRTGEAVLSPSWFSLCPQVLTDLCVPAFSQGAQA